MLNFYGVNTQQPVSLDQVLSIFQSENLRNNQRPNAMPKISPEGVR